MSSSYLGHGAKYWADRYFEQHTQTRLPDDPADLSWREKYLALEKECEHYQATLSEMRVEKEVIITPAINDRIRELRKSKGLTMEQFGDVIGLTKATVSRLESGAVSATEQTVKSICREFGVSEAWLRTGEGPMLDDTSGSILDRLTAEYHLDDRKRAILTAFLKLSPADQDAILRYVDGVVSELNAQPAAPDLDVDAEVEAYRQELLAQKKAEAAASATAGSAAG